MNRMRRIARYITLLLMPLLLVACSITRYLHEDEYLVYRVEVKSDKSVPHDLRITQENSELLDQIQQRPNRRLLMMNIPLRAYYRMQTKGKNSDFLKRNSQPPVLFDEEKTMNSVRNLTIYMHSRGYFSSTVDVKVDTTHRKRRAKVTYYLTQNEPTIIESLSYNIEDSALSKVILTDTANCAIHSGDIFDVTLLDRERKRITSLLNQDGFYDFTINNINYTADTIGLHNRARLTLNVTRKNHAIYRIKNVNIFPTYNPAYRATNGFSENAHIDTISYGGMHIIRTNAIPRLRNKILFRTIPIQPNSLYDSELVSATYNDLTALGVFSNTRINFEPVDGPLSRATYVGKNPTDAEQFEEFEERLLNCNIYCSPATQNSAKLEFEVTAAATLFSFSPTLAYTNTNIFHGAEAFDISARYGFDLMRGSNITKRSAHELNITTGLSFPRFLLPFTIPNVIQPKTRIELSYDYQNRRYYHRNIFTGRLAYSWHIGTHSTFVLRPIDINLIVAKHVDEGFLSNINNKYLENSFKSQLNAGLTGTYTFNTQINKLDPTSTLLRVNFETSGNLFQGINSIFSHYSKGKDYYEVFGQRYSQYARIDINLSHTHSIGEKIALAGRIFMGAGLPYGNSKGWAIPFDKMFYCGGANSMRGWAPRTLGPGSVDLYTVTSEGDTQQSTSHKTYPAQVGDMRLEANVELRFPIWGIWNGALFFDVGNVWYLNQSPTISSDQVFNIHNFYEQLGFNTGLGVRIDISFVILRLDWGLQLYNPNRPVGERWLHDQHFTQPNGGSNHFVGKAYRFLKNNSAISFGVGYPF